MKRIIISSKLLHQMDSMARKGTNQVQIPIAMSMGYMHRIHLRSTTAANETEWATVANSPPTGISSFHDFRIGSYRRKSH